VPDIPIPATCADRPTIGGRVIPYINVQLRDGGVDFRRQHRSRVIETLVKRLCQVCAQPLRHPIVLLGGPEDLKHLTFHEPPAHAECAVYATKACPMLAGERTRPATGPSVVEGRRGEQCPDPGCDCVGWVNNDPDGEPVPPHPWYAVYVSTFQVYTDPGGHVEGALVFPEEVLVVRLVSRPGEGRCWQVIPDALDGYEPPEMSPSG
jgi:hypothetical protein